MILKQLMARALAGHHGTVNLLLLLQWLQQQREAGFGQVCIACCSFCFPGAVAGEKSKGENWQVSLAGWSLAGYQSCLAAGSQEQKGLSSHAGVHPGGLERAQLWVQCQPWAGAASPSLPAPQEQQGRQQLSALPGPSSHPRQSRGSEFPLPGLWGVCKRPAALFHCRAGFCLSCCLAALV